MKTFRNFGLMIAALTALVALTGCDPIWSVETASSTSADRVSNNGPLDPSYTQTYIKTWSMPEGFTLTAQRPSGAVKLEWKDVLASARAELANAPTAKSGELYVHAWMVNGTCLSVTKFPQANQAAWADVLNYADRQVLAQK